MFSQLTKFSLKLSYLPLYFQKIPEVIFQMENLETLWLRYNKITFISPEIGRMKKLKMVDLRENKITALPVEIGQLESLSILLLSSNHLKSLPEGKNFNLKLLIFSLKFVFICKESTLQLFHFRNWFPSSINSVGPSTQRTSNITSNYG